MRNSELVRFVDENNIDLYSFDEVSFYSGDGMSLWSKPGYPSQWDVADKYFNKDYDARSMQLVGHKNKIVGVKIHLGLDFKFIEKKFRRGSWLFFRWRFEWDKFAYAHTVIYDHQTNAVMVPVKNFYKNKVGE